MHIELLSQFLILIFSNFHITFEVKSFLQNWKEIKTIFDWSFCCLFVTQNLVWQILSLNCKQQRWLEPCLFLCHTHAASQTICVGDMPGHVGMQC